MSNWSEVTIADVACPKGLVGGPFGSKLVSRDYVGDGTAVIRGQNLSDGRWVSFVDAVYVTGEKVDRDLRGNLAEAGDLVYTQRGTLGQVAVMPDDSNVSVISQSQMRLRVDASKADPMFVYYWSTSPDFRKAISDHAIVAGVPHINLGILGALPIVLPPRPVQSRIAYVLGTLDDLIENNRRRVEVLEEMARAIYREWFVKFRYPGNEDVPRVDSALGPIPEGWVVSTIGDVAAIVTRGIAPKYAGDGPSVVLNQKCIRDERVSFGPSRRQERNIPDAKYVSHGDVLINSTGVGTLGRVAMYRGRRPDVTVDSHITIARPSNERLNPWFGFALVSKKKEFERLGTGSTGQTELSRRDIGASLVAMPPERVLDAFAGSVWPLLEQADAVLAANESTAALRDLLLPKLVTGHIDVSVLDLATSVEESVA